MQIKFLTLYHNFFNHEKNLADAQRSLLGFWESAVFKRQMPFIPNAKVYFQDYSFFDYPDQEKAKKEIANAYGHKDKKTKAVEYWWGGEQYPDLDTLYNALAEQKRFMELTIEVVE